MPTLPGRFQTLTSVVATPHLLVGVRGHQSRPLEEISEGNLWMIQKSVRYCSARGRNNHAGVYLFNIYGRKTLLRGTTGDNL